jgi:hypothetical protein
MKSRDFAYWLQGFFELSESRNLSEKQVKMIKSHLDLVFVHEIDPQEELESGKTKVELNQIHNPDYLVARC